MAPLSSNPAAPHLILAIPYPGRGHINPMMSLCRLIASRRHHIRILVVVTEEWLGLLGSEQYPDRIRFVTIPNILPSELLRGSDHAGFLEAVLRDMEGPVGKALDKLELPPHVIMADTFVPWAIRIGRTKGIPVASFWPASASLFLVFYHHDLITSSQYYPVDLSGGGEDRIDFIPGIPPIGLGDLPDVFQLDRRRILDVVIECMSFVSQAKLILFRTINDLEEAAMDAIETKLSLPVYPIGPAIPYFDSNLNSEPTTSNVHSEPNYMNWLDCQRERSVLYISLGSFLSTSSVQVDELTAGLKESGVRFLWVGRDQVSQLSAILGDKGMVISWCDQMRVLQHPSVGGFLTHCGWNSTLETVFVGVPALTFPLSADQPLDSKMLVEDWNVGWRVKKSCRELVGRQEISRLLRRFMDLESNERKELNEKSKLLRERLLRSVAEDGSTSSLELFLCDVLHQ